MKPSLPSLLVISILAFSAAAWVGYHQINQHRNERNPLSDRVFTSSDRRVSNQRLTEVERQRAAIQQARDLSLAELKKFLLDQNPTHTPGFADSLLRTIAQDRWAREEPASYLEWAIQQYTSGDDLNLLRLIKDEPEIISTYLLSEKPAHLRVRLLSKMIRQDPDFAFRELPSFLSTDAGNDGYMRYALMYLAETQLAGLEKLMESESNPHLANAVFIEKMKGNFNEAFDQLTKRPDGFDILFQAHTYNRVMITKKLLARLGDLPESWRRQIGFSPSILYYALDNQVDRLGIAWGELGFSEDQSNKIRTGFLQSEAYHNPAPAFALLAEYEFTADEKREIFKRALDQTRTDEEWHKLRSNLTIPEDEALFDEMANARPTLAKQKIETPDDLFAAAQNNETPNYLSEMSRWPKSEKEDFYQRFKTADPEVKTRLAEIAARTFESAPSDFLGPALIHLLNDTDLQDPDVWKNKISDQNASHIAAKHTIDLLEKDPQEAQAWLNELPEGTIRNDATNNMALHWIKFDPTATDQWLESMPEEKRKSVSEFVNSHHKR
jgi:hypothetical protein